MSLPNWMIAGLGFPMKRIFPYLQAQNVRQRLWKQKHIALNAEDAAHWEKINDTDRFKLLLKYNKNICFQFADLIAQSDNKHLLSYGIDSDDNSYLYYKPSFPWEQEEEEFHTEEEAKGYICDVVMPFVGDQVMREDIIGLISEIYEIGCG